MKRFKKFLKDNILALIALADVAILLLFGYMMFGWMLDIAKFHAVMNSIAG